MPITRIVINNYKSIKTCDLRLDNLNLLIGENGTGKSNIIEAVKYFYENLTSTHIDNDIFDINNKFSNEVNITLYFDLQDFINKAKNNIKIAQFNDKETIYKNFYKKILLMKKYIQLNLKQIKGGQIKWNMPYEERFIIKSLFPCFYINSRDLDLLNWDYFWSIIGDLIKVSNDEQKDLKVGLSTILKNENYHLSKKIQYVEKILADSQFQISKSTSKDFAKLLAYIYFEGKNIQLLGKNLSYFSTGTNSLNYLVLLLKAISKLEEDKLKKPMFLIDEPELNLHHTYIDELSNIFIDASEKISIIISTHSSRLTKNVIKSQGQSGIYRVHYYNNYTHVNSMKIFTNNDLSAIYRVTDDHANAYFSKSILFVEGETELELFSNPYLRILYPALKGIDVFKAMTDNVIRDIMLPNKVNSKIPYFILIDMDKIVMYNSAKNKFEQFKREGYLKSISNVNKERYLYRDKNNDSVSTYSLHQRILSMTNKCRFHFYLPFYSSNDKNFEIYKKIIKEYYLRYRTYVCETTIEGMLINPKTLEIAMSFLKLKKTPVEFAKFENYYNSLYHLDKCNLLRLIFNGKTDFLYASKSLDKLSLSTADKNVIRAMKIGNKTNGWITEFIEHFFIEKYSMSLKDLKRSFDTSDSFSKKQFIRTFNSYFEELSDLLGIISKMTN